MAQPAELIDGIFAFPGGVNRGVAPLLLAKEGPGAQLGDAVNCTLRGDFVQPRPPFQQIALDADLPSALFQGAAYYKPDAGLESIMAALGGRLFQITPGTQGSAQASVVEQTIPGDPNPADAPQAWLWQSESWLIWNDGSSIPIFFDQSSTPTSRRSLQYQPGNYTVAQATFTIGTSGTAVLQLSAPYTNGPDFSMSINGDAGYIFNPQTGVELVLVNSNDTPGRQSPGGVTVIFNPRYGGTVVSGAVVVKQTYVNDKLHPIVTTSVASLSLNQVYPGALGDSIQIDGFQYPFTVTEITGSNIVAQNNVGIGGNPVGATVSVLKFAPSYVAGVTLASSAGAFTAPIHGGTVTIELQSSWPTSIVVGQYVFISGHRYQIQSINNNVTSTVVVTSNGTGGTYSLGAPIVSGQAGDELPPGRMGAYVLGRNWMALPDGQSFIASDLVGYSSGSKQYQFRDAVLRISSNQQLIGGGAFRVPSAGQSITAICSMSVINAALGQGPVQVFTSNTGFSCNAPVDQTKWQSLASPILPENIIGSGATSQASTVQNNGDILYRAPDGDRSLLLDQIAFNQWGNVPFSRELQPVYDEDDPALLSYESAAIFDNRRLEGVHPVLGGVGYFFDTITALNFVPLSSLRGKQPSIWDGTWTGLNMLQFVTGNFNSVKRCFAVAYNSDKNTIELWEVLTSRQNHKTAIEWQFETPVIDFGGKDPRRHVLKKMKDGELYIDQIVATTDENGNPFGLHFDVFLRPDYDTTWHPWLSWDVPVLPSYQPRMGLGEPPSDEDPATMMPFRQGYTFQVKIVIQGQCRFLGARFQAAVVPETEFAAPFQVG